MNRRVVEREPLTQGGNVPSGGARRYANDEDDGNYSYYSDDVVGSSNDLETYVVLGSIIPMIIQVTLLCILVFVFTYFYTKYHSCSNNREIWCKDDWYCTKQSASTDKIYSTCYQRKDHLASCLFGPNSVASTKCIDYSKKGVACPCSHQGGTATAKAGSCLAGCPVGMDKLSKNTVCCCDPKSKDCPNKTLPPQCV